MKIDLEWALSSYFFLSGLLSQKHPIVYLGWTLEWEMLFYLVFGLSLFFRSWLISLTFVFTVLSIVAIASSSYILLEFLGGLIIALIHYKRVVSARTGGLILGIGILLLSLSISQTIRDLDISRVIIWGIPSLLIVLGAISVTQFKSSFGRLLGDASYSIYLVQMFTIPVFYKVLSKFQLSINTDLAALFCLIASAFAGVFLYWLIEKPLTRLIKVLLMLKHRLKSANQS